MKEGDEGAGDLTGVVSGHAGEFLCPTCRRVSNALLPGSAANPSAVDSHPPPAQAASPAAAPGPACAAPLLSPALNPPRGKRKLEDMELAG